MTDEAPQYRKTGKEFSGHDTVNHSAEEYVRAHFWHTNTVEGYFSILKRGITGVYHAISYTWRGKSRCGWWIWLSTDVLLLSNNLSRRYAPPRPH